MGMLKLLKNRLFFTHIKANCNYFRNFHLKTNIENFFSIYTVLELDELYRTIENNLEKNNFIPLLNYMFEVGEEYGRGIKNA